MALALCAALAGPSRAQEDPGTAPPSAASRAGARGGVAPAPNVDGPSAPFSATVYLIRMPADQIGRLDAEALTTAAGTPDFGKALAGLGTVRPLYLVSQSVRLAEDTIRIGAQTPYVSNSQVSNTGNVINTTRYTSVGTIFDIQGKTKAAGVVELDLRLQVSSLDEASGVQITNNVKSPVFRLATMAFKGNVQAGKPFVLVSADGATLDADGKAVAYITKVTLGPLQ